MNWVSLSASIPNWVNSGFRGSRVIGFLATADEEDESDVLPARDTSLLLLRSNPSCGVVSSVTVTGVKSSVGPSGDLSVKRIEMSLPRRGLVRS